MTVKQRQRAMILFDDVYKKYPNGVEAIKNLNFRIEDGEFVFLMGASGAGKSTLIKLLMKEEEPTSGRVSVNGRLLSKIKRGAIQRYRRNIGVVFQDFRLLERKTVFQNVAFAMEILGEPQREINTKVDIVLDLMGLEGKKKEYPLHLSGGEQQRVALARAMVNMPKILIADEPTGNLDPDNSRQIMQLLMRINEKGTTVLVATHEQDMVRSFGKRVVYLDHGKEDSSRFGGNAATGASATGNFTAGASAAGNSDGDGSVDSGLVDGGSFGGGSVDDASERVMTVDDIGDTDEGSSDDNA